MASGAATITADSVNAWKTAAQKLGFALPEETVNRVARKLKRDQSDSEDEDDEGMQSKRRRR